MASRAIVDKEGYRRAVALTQHIGRPETQMDRAKRQSLEDEQRRKYGHLPDEEMLQRVTEDSEQAERQEAERKKALELEEDEQLRLAIEQSKAEAPPPPSDASSPSSFDSDLPHPLVNQPPSQLTERQRIELERIGRQKKFLEERETSRSAPGSSRGDAMQRVVSAAGSDVSMSSGTSRAGSETVAGPSAAADGGGLLRDLAKRKRRRSTSTDTAANASNDKHKDKKTKVEAGPVPPLPTPAPPIHATPPPTSTSGMDALAILRQIGRERHAAAVVAARNAEASSSRVPAAARARAAGDGEESDSDSDIQVIEPRGSGVENGTGNGNGNSHSNGNGGGDEDDDGDMEAEYEFMPPPPQAGPSGTSNQSLAPTPAGDPDSDSDIEVLEIDHEAILAMKRARERKKKEKKPSGPIQGKGNVGTMSAEGEMFWDGAVRSVRNELVKITTPTFSLADLIGKKEDLTMVIAASYCWEMDWFAQHLPDPKQVPTVIMTQPVTNMNGKVVQADEHTEGFKAGQVITFAFLPGGSGCQHMKYLMLFYKSRRMRIVVTSANLRSADWQIMENTVFVQDLPVVPVKAPTFPDHDWAIKFRSLFRYCKIDNAIRLLRKQHHNGSQMPLMPDNNFNDFGKWAWDKIKSILIMSLPGSHRGSDVDKYGMTSVSFQLRKHRLIPRTTEHVNVEYQSSSLTNLTPKWTYHMWGCFNGMTTTEMSKMDIPKKLPHQRTIMPPLKVLFPSLKTVDESIFGREGGGSMFCTDKHFTEDSKHMFCDSVCKYGNVLQHSKLVIALFKPKSAAFVPIRFYREKEQTAVQMRDEEVNGWAYMAGSHNLSAAAWGHVSWESGVCKIYIKSYELGVIVPIRSSQPEQKATQMATYKRPVKPYGATDIPFMQSLHMPV